MKAHLVKFLKEWCVGVHLEFAWLTSGSRPKSNPKAFKDFLRATACNATARLSYRRGVRPFACLFVRHTAVGLLYGGKTTQAKITKSSLSAATKTLVSKYVKSFPKFKRGVRIVIPIEGDKQQRDTKKWRFLANKSLCLKHGAR